MTIHYCTYKWKEGIPYGIEAVQELKGITYKIPMDPYRKRICIEKYQDGQFLEVIYDSVFLNFRHLKPENQMAWEKKIIDVTTAEIRDQDDRLVYIEKYTFEGPHCRECSVYSPHGILLSKHKMFYELLGDSFNGVILYDRNGVIVMEKHYKTDTETQEFTELIRETF